MELQTCQTKYNFDLLYVLRLIILGMILISAGSLLIYFRLKKYINILSNEMKSLKNENSQLKKDLGDVIVGLTCRFHPDPNFDPENFKNYIFENGKYFEFRYIDIDCMSKLDKQKMYNFSEGLNEFIVIDKSNVKKMRVYFDELEILDFSNIIIPDGFGNIVPNCYRKYVKKIKTNKYGFVFTETTERVKIIQRDNEKYYCDCKFEVEYI